MPNEPHDRGPMITVCGLWSQESQKDGSTYLTGTLGNVKIMVFPNRYYTEGTNQPDWTLCITPAPKKEHRQ